jgi:hypothetical protein
MCENSDLAKNSTKHLLTHRSFVADGGGILKISFVPFSQPSIVRYHSLLPQRGRRRRDSIALSALASPIGLGAAAGTPFAAFAAPTVGGAAQLAIGPAFGQSELSVHFRPFYHSLGGTGLGQVQ